MIRFDHALIGRPGQSIPQKRSPSPRGSAKPSAGTDSLLQSKDDAFEDQSRRRWFSDHGGDFAKHLPILEGSFSAVSKPIFATEDRQVVGWLKNDPPRAVNA